MKKARQPQYQEDVAIVMEELDRAFYQIGRRLFLERLDEYHATPDDESKLLKLVDNVVTRLASKRVLTDPRNQIGPVAYRAIAILEDLVFNQADPEGITLAEACQILEKETGHYRKASSLVVMLRRTQDSHQLVVRGSRLQRNGSLLIDLLERRFREQQRQNTRRLVSKPRSEAVCNSWSRRAG